MVTTDNETFGGTPAISHDRMFLRSNKHLYCVADTGASVEPNASTSLIDKPEADESSDGDQARGRSGFGGGGRGGGRGRGGFDPSAIFKSRDKNSDAKLTADELAGSPLADRFADIDKDGDKAITMEEFQSGLRNAFGGGRGGARGGRGGFGRGSGGDDKRPERPQRPQSVG